MSYSRPRTTYVPPRLEGENTVSARDAIMNVNNEGRDRALHSEQAREEVAPRPLLLCVLDTKSIHIVSKQAIISVPEICLQEREDVKAHLKKMPGSHAPSRVMRFTSLTWWVAEYYDRSTWAQRATLGERKSRRKKE
jgi:hypothetical protein